MAMRAPTKEREVGIVWRMGAPNHAAIYPDNRACRSLCGQIRSCTHPGQQKTNEQYVTFRVRHRFLPDLRSAATYCGCLRGLNNAVICA